MVVQVTPAMRFAAHRFVQRYNGSSDPMVRTMVVAVRQAHYAESFPGSYSPALVAASERLLAAVLEREQVRPAFPGSPVGFGLAVSGVLEAMNAPAGVQ